MDKNINGTKKNERQEDQKQKKTQRKCAASHRAAT